MRCFNCPFYKSGYMWNGCALTESECFREPESCDLVNDDGTVSDKAKECGFDAPFVAQEGEGK